MKVTWKIPRFFLHNKMLQSFELLFQKSSNNYLHNFKKEIPNKNSFDKTYYISSDTSS